MFGITAHDREVFTKNFLRTITFSAKYQENPTCSELADRFVNLFTDVMPVKQVNPGVRFNLDANGIQRDESYQSKQIVLHSSDMRRNLMLSDESCEYVVSGDQYKSSEDMMKIFKKASVFLETCGINKLARLSMRKQNILQFQCVSASDLPVPVNGPVEDVLNNNLLLPYSVVQEINPFIKQSMNTLQLEDNGYILTLRYGFQIQNKEDKKRKATGLLILDLEIYKQDVLVDSIDEELSVFSKELYNAFIWAISKNTLTSLQNG